MSARDMAIGEVRPVSPSILEGIAIGFEHRADWLDRVRAEFPSPHVAYEILADQNRAVAQAYRDCAAQLRAVAGI